METLLETPRLFLRRSSQKDAEFILQLLNEPSFLQHIGDRGVRTAEDARSYISNKIIASYDSFGFGMYIVETKEGVFPIGIAGFVKRPFLQHPDIGFAFLERCWSKGYAYESAVAVRDYGRAILGFDCILGVTSPNNHNSIRLLEKLGLRFEKMIQLHGHTVQQKLFSTPEPQAPSGRCSNLPANGD